MYGSGFYCRQVDFSAPSRLALALLIAAASAPEAVAAQTWTSVGPPVSIQALAVGASQPAPARPGVIYASITGVDGIFSSTDGGASWRYTGPIFLAPRVGCCAPPGPALHFQLYADPDTPGTAYALADGFLYKTMDGGLTWPPGCCRLNNLAFGPSGQIYGVFDFGFVSTTNGFATISEVDSAAGPFTGLAVDPADPKHIYVSSTSSHLIYSSAGATLMPLPELPDSFDPVIQLAVDGSTKPSTLLVLVRPSDAFGAPLYVAQPGVGSGSTPFWTASANLPGGLQPTAIAIDPNVPGAVYLASTGGFFVSHDHGNSWTQQQAGLRSNHVLGLALDPTLLGPLWAGTDSGLAMLGRGGCRAGGATACLDGARFQTQVSYQLGGQTATATAVQLSDETAAFWFTDASNYELLVKVLDGTAVNGEFWVFSGGLSDLEYTVTVTDVLTGAAKTYPKAAGILKSFADTGAFPGKAAAERVAAPPGARSAAFAPAAVGGCTAGATELCLEGSRFQARVSFQGGSLSGSGEAVPLTDDTGSFWFLAADNYELTVKILDGTAVNGHFWVFYGAMTDLAFTLTVTDTTDGKVKTYTNTAGTIPSAADTSTF
jgi:hypothetical protein